MNPIIDAINIYVININYIRDSRKFSTAANCGYCSNGECKKQKTKNSLNIKETKTPVTSEKN